MRLQYCRCRFTALSIAIFVAIVAPKVVVSNDDASVVVAVLEDAEDKNNVLHQPLLQPRDVADELFTSELLLLQDQELLQQIEQQEPPPQQQQQQPLLSFKAWSVKDFPNPSSSSLTPGCHHGRICDPDAILTTLQIDSLFAMIQELEQTKTIPCNAHHDDDNDKDASSRGTLSQQQENDASDSAADTTKTTIANGIPVQLAVAIIQKMDLTSFHHNDGDNYLPIDTTRAAEIFARSLHDKWGVGYRPNVIPQQQQQQCGGGGGNRDGGTGIVIFVSILDRALYISRGGAMESVLTNARLDSIIDQCLKPNFRAGQYSDGLKLAIRQIGIYMDQGPPSNLELYGVLVVVGIVFLFMLGMGAYEAGTAKKQYAHVASQLNQLDRSKAEALQGQYRTTSCPICLEDFKVKKQKQQQSRTTSSDESPTPLLPAAAAHLNNNKNLDHVAALEDDDPAAMSNINNLIGSDGLPVKLLHCGHVFDETCWTEWVNKGRSDVTRCPICQQDVGGAPPRTSTTTTSTIRRDRQHEQEMRRYQHERHFRLMQLSSRYPQYVQHEEVQNWTRATYDGSMVRDPTFVRRNPQLQQHSATSSSSLNGNRSSSLSHSSGTMSFGGGFSSGGRGAQW